MSTQNHCILSMLSLLMLPGCQDGAAASADASAATVTTTTSESDLGTPTTGSTGIGATGTNMSGAFTTTSSGDGASASEEEDPSNTSDTTHPVTGTDEPSDTSTSIPGNTTNSDTTTGSSHEASTGEDSTTSPIDPPEPPACFPKQVPWAQPCQADIDGVKVLANIPNSAYGIAVDETHVYFTDYSPPGSPKLHRVSKCGGAVETIASAGSNPCRIEMDHLSVYISDLVDNGAIYRVAKSDGSVGVVAANLTQTCPSVVATEDAILFSGHQQPGIWKVKKPWGDQPELFHPTDDKRPGWMDTNGVHLYWNVTWVSDVARVLVTGGPSEFVTDDLGDWPFEVGCDHVYGNSTNAPGFWRVSVDGGPPEKVALQAAHRSVMADTHVYFTSAGSHEIVEVPLDGGAPGIVANIGNPGLLAVDETHVFWSDPDAPVIRMAPRPKV